MQKDYNTLTIDVEMLSNVSVKFNCLFIMFFEILKIFSKCRIGPRRKEMPVNCKKKQTGM